MHNTTASTDVAWLVDTEVADLLGVSVWTVRSWRTRELGPPYYKIEGSIRYDRAEVTAWRTACRQPGAAS